MSLRTALRRMTPTMNPSAHVMEKLLMMPAQFMRSSSWVRARMESQRFAHRRSVGTHFTEYSSHASSASSRCEGTGRPPSAAAVHSGIPPSIDSAVRYSEMIRTCWSGPGSAGVGSSAWYSTHRVTWFLRKYTSSGPGVSGAAASRSASLATAQPRGNPRCLGLSLPCARRLASGIPSGTYIPGMLSVRRLM